MAKRHINRAHDKIVEKDRVILNTPHYSVQAVETPEGVVIDVFHRHGDLIDTFTFWNDDVMDRQNYHVIDKY